MNQSGKPPEQTARVLADTTDEFAEYRIHNCDSIEHLRAAVRHEAEHEARPERIAAINQRIAEVQK